MSNEKLETGLTSHLTQELDTPVFSDELQVAAPFLVAEMIMLTAKRNSNANCFFHSGEWPSKQVNFNDRRYLVLKGSSCGITEIEARKSFKELVSPKISQLT